MSGRLTLLKALLMKRHQVTHRAFCLEYDKVARSIDRTLVGSSPSKEAFNRWVNGRVRTKPQADHCRVLERMFPGHTVAELLGPYDPGTKDSNVPGTRSDSREAATNRREVLHLGAAVALGLPESIRRGPDLLEQALDSTSAGEGRLLYLESESDRLGLTLESVLPATLMAGALTHLSSVRELLTQRQPIETQRRLARIGAKLSIVVGHILFNTDQFPMARRWYMAAARAAEEAGDSVLADLALVGSTFIPMYSAEPQTVLSAVTPRLEQAVGATPPLAWLWGMAAVAHASLGERAVFERCIERSRNMLDRCEPTALHAGVLSFELARQTFYEARGRADLGDVDGTGDATNRALAIYDPTVTSDPALVRFAHASVLAKTGEVEEACRIATAALRDPHTLPIISVVVRAYDFDAVLTQTGSTTADWREALADLRVLDSAGISQQGR
ncbi:hypothetical protein GCM10009677_28040 [Sphaerisporangium rubeum]|uniref:XRE family transcriptional regulator n=1 Tax=Sphaerisporangium rubeum TaxID=321317 RepID=A0A7X0ICV5_9ACTN|nr:hypothetical protein [Sphaerisporangium rubeum]MBB6472916.1 hypothetical protein [Sphaerisporangium rubeum]